MTEPTIPGYRIAKRLDSTGTTEVWEAADGAGRKVALKLYSPKLSAASRESLVQSLQKATELRHQNLVAVLAHGEHDGRIWSAMELLAGAVTAKDLQKRSRPTPAQILGVVRQAALGLAYAHDHGVVTRSLSPERLLVQGQGRVVKVLEPGVAAEAALDASRTATMADMGALRYMAPELGRDPLGDARADVYSLGVIAYEMLTGRVPLGGVKLPSQLNEDVPAAVDPVIMHCIAKAPGERLRDMRALVQAVDELATTTPSLAQPGGRMSVAPAPGKTGRTAAIVAAAAAILAIAALLLSRACV